MKSIAVLLGIIVLTSLAFWPMTGMVPDDVGVSSTQVLGIPVLGVGTSTLCWLSIGTGFGVLFVGFAGAGVVALGLAAGGGLLFGSGQLSCGLIALGQLALGVVFMLGQVGFGMAGLGQVVLGGLVKAQAQLGKDGGAFLSQLNQDIDRMLWPGRGAEPPRT